MCRGNFWWRIERFIGLCVKLSSISRLDPMLLQQDLEEDCLGTSSCSLGYLQHILEFLVGPLPKCSPPIAIENDLRPIPLTCQVDKIMVGFTLESPYQQVDELDDKIFALPCKSCVYTLIYLLHHILASL